MSRRIVLFRHGQTDWNAENRAQGWTDIPLNSIGLAQARHAAPLLSSYDASVLVSSDLERARQTAEIVGAALGLTPEFDPRWREFDVGERSGLSMAEFQTRYPTEYAAWMADDESIRVIGAESSSDVRARMEAAFAELTSRLSSDQTAIVVTHGAALKVAVCALIGWPTPVRGDLVGIGNCHWVELIEAEPGVFRLGGYNLPGDLGTPDFSSAEGVG